jgi:hypothetical protein
MKKGGKKVAYELVKLAKQLLEASDEWLTAEDVEVFCASCANKMRAKGIKKVKASVIGNVLAKRIDGQWDKLPKGWTKDSLNKFWDTLTGEVKHKVTKCIKKIEESDSGIDDAGAFCASLADKMEPGWRSR